MQQVGWRSRPPRCSPCARPALGCTMRQGGLPDWLTLAAYRHGGMTELGDAGDQGGNGIKRASHARCNAFTSSAPTHSAAKKRRKLGRQLDRSPSWQSRTGVGIQEENPSRNDSGRRLVGAGRFELPTPCSRSKCATRLRYAPPDRSSPLMDDRRASSGSRGEGGFIATMGRGRKRPLQ